MEDNINHLTLNSSSRKSENEDLLRHKGKGLLALNCFFIINSNSFQSATNESSGCKLCSISIKMADKH